MQNEHAAINRRLSDPDFQASLLSRSIGLALGLSLLTTVFIAHDVYLWTHPPTPKYFVIDGRKTREVTALDTPIVDDAQLLDWSTRAALAPYNINYNDYPQQLSAASRKFSKRGWNSFATSVMDTKNFDTMKRSMLLCYAQAQRAAVISEVATIAGARTGEGRSRAKARGVHMGRPPALTRHQREEALAALAEGSATQADLARRFNVSRSTISRL